MDQLTTSILVWQESPYLAITSLHYQLAMVALSAWCDFLHQEPLVHTPVAESFKV